MPFFLSSSSGKLPSRRSPGDAAACVSRNLWETRPLDPSFLDRSPSAPLGPRVSAALRPRMTKGEKEIAPLNPERSLQHTHLVQDRIDLGFGRGVLIHAAIQIQHPVVQLFGPDGIFDQGDG